LQCSVLFNETRNEHKIIMKMEKTDEGVQRYLKILLNSFDRELLGRQNGIFGFYILQFL
jgi:hypothetical protein